MTFYTPTLEHPRLKGFRELNLGDDFIVLCNGEEPDLDDCTRVLIFHKASGEIDLSYWAGDPEFLSNAWYGIAEDESEFEEVLERMADQCEW